MCSATDLNREGLRQPQSKNKVCLDKEFVGQFISDTPPAQRGIVTMAADRGISSATTDCYVK
jgi:hypothetical protein